MATKKRKPAAKPAKAAPSQAADAGAYLSRIADALERVVEILEVMSTAPEPAGDKFMSGGFHRRAGDVYERVAEPGSPNAGDVDDNNPSGSV